MYFSCFLASQERFYFGDNVLPCFESGIPLLKNRLQQLPDSDKVRSSDDEDHNITSSVLKFAWFLF